MTVSQLHPEDLLDKDARGEITAAESERLEAHLVSCATCRFEREVRADFRAELDAEDGTGGEEISAHELIALAIGGRKSPPNQNASRLDESANESANETAKLETLDETRDETVEEVEAAAKKSIRPRRASRVWLLVAAAVMIGGVAGAGVGARAYSRFVGSSQEAAEQGREDDALAGASKGQAAHSSSTSSLAGATSSPELEGSTAHAPFEVPASPGALTARAPTASTDASDTSVVADKSSVIVPVHLVTSSAGAGDRAGVGVGVGDRRAGLEPPASFARDGTRAGAGAATSAGAGTGAATLGRPITNAAPPDGATGLFEAANDARRHGDHARAITLDRELEAKYPLSREAHVSFATLGQLLLDRGDAAGALVAFEAYRNGGGGPLDEAVMAGRAKAFERLGRDGDARAAWSALLAAFPGSPYADHAKARLERADTLGDGPSPR